AKGRPSPYYAILAADGDNMGAMLDSLADPVANREFSQALSGFAEKARKIIEDHHGMPIYLGGDDILTYLPLDTALACVSELQKAFGSVLHKLNLQGSLSGGLVIAHHLQPLSEVLNLARRAEKEAKGIEGKKALCIVLNKRSGAERFIKAKRDVLIERLQTLVTLHRQEAISKGTAYELQNLYRRLEGVNLPEDALKDAFQKEAIRIVKRKRESGSEESISDKVQKQFKTWIETISIGELALEMIVAEIFAKAQDEAKLPLPEKEAQA
ncbi:MAG: type III-B CRISPR-associated protein Cas10/Cmr2, partial [Chloroflexota bacterium]